jgi:flagellar hook-basal body complex protein FliE
MSVIASLTSLFNHPPSGDLELANVQESAASAASALGGLAGASAPQSAASTKSFSEIMEQLVGEVDGTIKAADTQKAKVLSGESTNLHQAMIAMQEAGVAFSMMVEVRNKLVESYQEIMRMQV